ncbi:MAG TPA: DNA methyltransferase [Candidatus Dormibacteraeota bacterium]|nr:DNA methyltransferase [Candidatus Dormibacteraeota bacterium]
MAKDYHRFLLDKTVVALEAGISINGARLHPVLFEFQRDLAVWALRKGRAAIFADCGLGKTLMQLEWARMVGGPVLIVAPLCVAEQTIAEARNRLGMEVRFAETLADRIDAIVITNYEKLHHFIGGNFEGIVLDESSILKSIDGKTRGLLLEKFTDIPMRLCCTATPCPNDIAEIANHAEFLGVMRRVEMLATFFVHDDEGWRLRGHAADAFYRWLASWAISMKSPADLGYDAGEFTLPELDIAEAVVKSEWRREGELFPGQLRGITDRAAVRKSTAPDRVMRAAELIAAEPDRQWLVWCGLNLEQDQIAATLGEECVSVSGKDSPTEKVRKEKLWREGRVRTLITKPRVFGFGMNWQHCSRMAFLGLSDSYESYYQCIRRSWRFGQKENVTAYIVVSDHEKEIVENVRRKEREALTLSSKIIEAAKGYEMEELAHRESQENLETWEKSGDDWRLMRGDCVVEMAKLADSSIDLSVFSPPFASLYVYSADSRDLGNSRGLDQFFAHFGFCVEQLLRVTKPGRLACVHIAQIPTTLVNDGLIGMRDFRGETIRSFESKGWIYHGEVCIDKDPQAQAIRTHSKGLLFAQLRRDASWLRPALADYILVFRKPGENAVPIHPDLTNDEWIEWARPIWYGIRESETLNAVEAREKQDERHICPLQLGTIERCIRLWSNPGELILSPFAGIGSEGYVALGQGRRFVGIELKQRYAEVAIRNLERALAVSEQTQLFIPDGISGGCR